MRWDRFFEDLEDQLDSEWEAERAALDSEAERLRLAHLTLRDRLSALCDSDGALIAELADGSRVEGRLVRVGRDWMALDLDAGRSAHIIIPLAAICAVATEHERLLRSARADVVPTRAGLSERMGLGFVLRDLARRRVPVTARLADGRALSGTIDRAMADHLDLALHEPGAIRRAGEVTGMRMIPFPALCAIRLDSLRDGGVRDGGVRDGRSA